ncbi:MAG TPA: DMT family transporter [Chitinophagales bacterium]|nr:DMT family transporter [Chitinophagales bacterium]
MDQHPKPLDWLLLFFLALIWGSSFILMKKGLEAFRPDQVAALRIAITAIVLLPFAWMRRREAPLAKVKTIWLQGMFGNFIPAFLFTAAQAHIDSSTAGILNSLSPVWVFVLGIFFFQSKYNWLKLTGIAFAFGGVLLLMIYQPGQGTTSNANFVWLIVVATFCYGLSANLIKKHLHDVRPITITAISFAIMLIPAIVYLFSTGLMQTVREHQQAYASLGFIAILATMGSAVASVTFNKIIHRTSALFASSVTYLIPIVAVGWGFLASEQIGVIDLFGMLMIFAGVYLVSR